MTRKKGDLVMLETQLTKMFGIKYPIQCGTMHGITLAELTAAVANAGGFCCISSAFFQTRDEFMDEIKKTRDLTDQPFGVNVGLFPAMRDLPVEERLDWVTDSGVTILETAGRSPEPYRDRIRSAGLIHIHKCARLRDAVKVDKMGVDVVSIVGTECGGHPSMEEVTSLILAPLTAESISAPLIVGGGFCDGKTLVAGLALGADAVNMGTRFMSTLECPIHPNAKQAIMDAREFDTMLVMKAYMNPSRVLKTPWAEKILDMELKGASIEELAPYISGDVGRKGWQQGNITEGMMGMGQTAGRITNCPTVAETIQSIVKEAEAVLERLSSLRQGDISSHN
ncbi:MAG: nitronate monooxygenase family protein [Desulfobacterales bacterium]